ncbi:hypothetical protein PCL_09555 [Purpureocillium lilacinum]|uniref:Uncharacterized protein n=1 Tax=Purpureocillium lilacinum TaxID=33203 RepID=A0A2U3DQL3_PURLI|nr:hypothetical protein PCL_09555 [Purpureocillium lilacinum]
MVAVFPGEKSGDRQSCLSHSGVSTDCDAHSTGGVVRDESELAGVRWDVILPFPNQVSARKGGLLSPTRLTPAQFDPPETARTDGMVLDFDVNEAYRHRQTTTTIIYLLEAPDLARSTLRDAVSSRPSGGAAFASSEHFQARVLGKMPLKRSRYGGFPWLPSWNMQGATPKDKRRFHGQGKPCPSTSAMIPASEEIRLRIISTWKAVNEGLFRCSCNDYLTRVDELRALCLGAGASTHATPTKQLLGKLDEGLSCGSRESPGFKSLKLEKRTSKHLLLSTLNLLAAYAKEIEVVNNIQMRLKAAQVGLREPEAVDWASVQGEIASLADSAGTKLIHFHWTLFVLQLDIEKEARGHLIDGGLEWVYLYLAAYPKFVSSSSKR